MLEATEKGNKLIFHPGPVFTNFLLADEINRASPKTQSALLEAMQEHRVTVLGETRDLPFPFYVLATQNPIELEGTYPLPEAQLDRFLFKLNVGSVDSGVMTRILLERRGGLPPELQPVTNAEGLKSMFEVVDSIYLPPAVAGYIGRLVAASHPNGPGAPKAIAEYVRHGASPRAAIAIADAARAYALLAGKPNVGFDDARAVAIPAMGHRIVLDYRARLDGRSGSDLIRELLGAVPEVGADLPGARA